MRTLFQIFIFSILTSGSFVEADDCGCEPAACSPCEEAKGLDFYTEKCDSGRGIKSCAKPLCKLKVPAPAGCGPGPARDPASVQSLVANAAPSPGVDFARVEFLRGPVIVHRAGQKIPLNVGDNLLAGDVVETDETSEARLRTQSGDTLHIQKSTRATLATPRTEKAAAVIELLRGKIRSQVVKSKPGPDQTSFQINTRSAVAGVRGTDFITSYQAAPQERTTVQTFEGEVVLYGKATPQRQAHIHASEFASYAVASAGQEQEFVQSGGLSPVRKMNETAARELAEVSWVGPHVARSTAAQREESFVCHEPAGKFNDCAWTCVNNPAKEKHCRTERADVQCVRKRCNANGEWTEETRLPASFHGLCDPAHPRIAPCDY